MAETIVNNGVNVEALLAAREALKSAPDAAKFTWRASCKWRNGTHSQTNIRGFHGLGEEQKHKTEFSFEADHPEIFASEDNGVTPIEYVLVGLATSRCLAERSIDHVVLERGEVANSWRHERWDSLRLLTPNWQSRLPRYRYEGADPDGFMTMAQVVQFISRFAALSGAPVRT